MEAPGLARADGHLAEAWKAKGGVVFPPVARGSLASLRRRSGPLAVAKADKNGPRRFPVGALIYPSVAVY